jgi:molybdenum cofactor cytidylyltransferase
MGRAKALLPMPDGTTALARLVATFDAAGTDEVVAVIGHHADMIRGAAIADGLRLHLVQNQDPSRGQLSSLVTALRWLEPRGADAVLVMPVDQPLVRAETVRRIMEVWREIQSPIVRPARAGRHGHPVLFSSMLFPELLAADLELGARPVIARHADAAADVECDDPGAFDDIDTPEDYQRIVGSRA